MFGRIVLLLLFTNEKVLGIVKSSEWGDLALEEEKECREGELK